MKRCHQFGWFMLASTIVATGCNGGDEAATENGSGENDDEVVLELFSWRNGETEEFNRINEEFQQEHPNISIDFQPTTAPEYDTALNTQLSTDTAADIFFVRPFALGENIYDAGHLEVLTEDDVPNLANISESQLDIYQSDDGDVYGVPFNYISYGFLYNEDMFDEFGLEEPETWDEFFDVMAAIEAEGVTPLAIGTADDWVVDEIIANGFYSGFVGGESWREGLIAGENSLTDPEYVDFLENLTEWSQYMPDNMSGIGYIDAMQMFMSQNAAIWVTGSWALTDLEGEPIDFEMNMFQAPVADGEDTRWVSMNGGAAIGINNESEHVEEAKLFLDWLISEDAQGLLADLLPGQFPVGDVPVDELQEPVNQKWLEAGGTDDENYAIGLGYDVFNSGEPAMSTLHIENIGPLLQGDITPEEAAERMQDGLSSWYEPLQ